MSAAPVRVFISYSHKAADLPYVRKILERVLALKQERVLSYWIDHDLLPGEEWETNINVRIDNADIFLALVSPAYRASAYCTGELERALDRREGGLEIVPILLRGMLPEHLQTFQALPSATAPLARAKREREDEVYNAIETALHALAKRIAALEATSERTDLDATRIPDIAATTAERLTADVVEELTLDEWQAAFWHLYGGKDREAKLYEMMLQLVADATRLAEGVRKNRVAETLEIMPRLFTWIVNLTTKCAPGSQSKGEPSYADLRVHGTLADLAWRKYPNRCSLCVEKPCVCSSRRVDDLTTTERQERDLANQSALEAARLKVEDKPHRINDWVEMFRTVYGPAHARLSLSHKALHFFEEVGELEVELRKADKVRAGVLPKGTSIELGQELADVFSWLVSIYVHISESVADAQRFTGSFVKQKNGTSAFVEVPSFSAWLWHGYGHDEDGGLRCHVCDEPVCTCKVRIPRR